jgi:hypothetical protein
VGVGAILAQPGDRIVAAVFGDEATTPSGGWLVRLTGDGQPDSGFGANGVAEVTPSSSLAADAAGRILVGRSDLGVGRYLADGTRDPLFRAAPASQSSGFLTNVRVAPDGTIFAVGFTWAPRHESVVARFHGDESAPPPTRGNTKRAKRPRIAIRGPRRRCVRRGFRLRVRLSGSVRLKGVAVRLDRRTILRRRLSTRRARLRVPVRAAHMRRGRHRVQVAVRDASGNRTAKVFRFRRCR